MGIYDDILQSSDAAPGGVAPGIYDDILAAEQPSMAEDVARAGASGLARGAIGLPGMLGNLQEFSRGAGRLAGFTPPGRSILDRLAGGKLPTSEDVVNAASDAGVPGLHYQPQTTAGEYARTIGEFVPGAMMGPGGVAKSALKFGVAPAVASETAGIAAREVAPELEPYARFGGAIAGGGLSALAGRPSVAERALASSARGMTPAQVDAAVTLFEQSRQGANPIPLTLAEAAGNERMLNLQRVVEGQGGLSEFMAQRPAQVHAAGRTAMETIAPVTQNPSMIGPQIGEAAQGTVQDVTDAINRRSRSLYQAAETVRVDPADWQRLQADPLYMSVLNEVRRDPALNRTIANLPDDSVGVIDLVQRRMRERGDVAATPGQASTSNLAAANLESARTPPIQAANAATGSTPATALQPATIGAYEQARGFQEAMRRQYLEPLMAGPIGKLAQKDLDTRNAVDALFPQNPIPNSAQEVQTAVSALSARNPMAARQLVRAHVESVFNQATRDMQSGPTQFGGATFRAKLVGNQQQAANLSAAISALPNGEHILAGFDQMLGLMEATGRRQRIGSQTAFNAELQSQLKQGSIVGESAATGGVKLPQRLRDAYQAWNLGRNVDQVAHLLTDPEAIPVFRALANAPSGSAKAIAAATRLAVMAQSSNKKDRK
jgi:hypothetical protein